MHLEMVFLIILIIISVQRLELNVCSFHLESLVSMLLENREQWAEGHTVVKTHCIFRHQKTLQFFVVICQEQL